MKPKIIFFFFPLLLLFLLIIFILANDKRETFDFAPDHVVELIDKDEKTVYDTLNITKSNVEELNSEMVMTTKHFVINGMDCRLQFRILDATNTLFNFTYIFENQPINEIYSWVCDQKETLTSYFGKESTFPSPKFIDRKKDLGSGINSRYGDGWMVDEKYGTRIYLTVDMFSTDDEKKVVRVSIFRSKFLNSDEVKELLND